MVTVTSSKNYNVSIDRLITAARFDVDYFRPEFIELDDLLSAIPNVKFLGELAEVEYGFMPTEDYATPEGGIPLIRVTNILPDGTIDMTDIKYIRATSKGLESKLVREKDILMVQCGNTTGKVAIVPEDLEGNLYASFCFRIRLRTDEVIPEYLFAVLYSGIGYKQIWRTITYSTVRPNTTKPYTEAIRIPVPNRDVQERIINIIQGAREFRRIELEKANAILEDLKKFVLKEVGVDLTALQQHRTALKPINSICGGRFDFEAVVTLQDINFSGTTSVLLKDVVERIDERVTPVSDCPDIDVNYIGLGNIASNVGQLVDFEPVKGIEVLSSSPTFQRGDILYGRMRPYLNKAWVAEFDGVCSGEALVLRPIKGKVNVDFLHALLLSPITLYQVVPLQSGTSLPRVSASDLLNTKLPIPRDLKKQERIGVEIKGRRDKALAMRIEANKVLSEAKTQVEKILLGEEDYRESWKQIPAALQSSTEQRAS